MANYATLKTSIQNVVKTNGNNEITGALLQQTLFAMVNSLGAKYQFAGVATPSTNPGTPDQNVFYIASTPGDYSNFGTGNALYAGEIAIFVYNGSWTKLRTSIGSNAQVIKVVGKGTTGDAAGITGVGQVYYNTSTGLFRICTQYEIGNSLYETIEPTENTIFVYNNNICSWDGSNLVPINNFGDKLIKIIGAASDGTSAGITGVGQVYYNTSTKLLRRCIQYAPNNNLYETVPYYDGAIYTMYDDLWIWDGSDLISIGTSAITETIDIPLQMGNLSTTYNGWQIGGTNIPVNMLSRQVSPNFLRFNPETDKINSISTENNEGFSIFCYDESFNLLGYVNDYSILPRTKYIKFVLRVGPYVNGMPTSVFLRNRILQINITHAGKIEFVKNSYSALETCFVSFEIQIPEKDDNSLPVSSYRGNQTRCWDNGYIILPPNYSRNGDPVPLIIFAHGSSGYSFAETEIKFYGDLLQFLAQNGYAVADCSAQSAYYALSYWGAAVSTSDSKGNPLALSCYRGLYQFLTQNYNVRTDGVYVLSKSSGGILSAQMAYAKPFPIRAISSLAPALSTAGASWRLTDAPTVNFWMALLGFPEPNITYPLTPANREYVLENFDKINGFDPFFFGTDLDFKALLTRMYALNPGSGATMTLQLENAYLSDSDLVNAIENGKKYFPVPIKFWVAIDDDNIPTTFVRWFKKMIDNTSGICYVRWLPENTGKHHAVDTDPGAITVNFQTKYAGIVNIPVAYAETIDWFNRW